VAAFPAPPAPCWSLIGRIGTAGRIFSVGTQRIVTAPIAGKLYLGVNDSNPAGNSGSWNVAVTIVPKGSVLTSSVPAVPLPTSPAPVSQAFLLTGIRPAVITASRALAYTISGRGLTAQTVVSLENLRAYIGSRAGVADFLPAAVARDGSWARIFIGPLPPNVGSVRIVCRQAGFAPVFLNVPVRQ
jgi:hypothetical protein